MEISHQKAHQKVTNVYSEDISSSEKKEKFNFMVDEF